MDFLIHPGTLSGNIDAIPSKSLAHRLLICASFADKPVTLICPEACQDIMATVDCLRELGADIEDTENGYHITPIKKLPANAVLHCRESGSTLRFLLPIAGALGIDATFQMEGSLPQRPLSPLWEEMTRMGCHLTCPTENTVRCQGKLQPGEFTIAGNVSSQFISGLLFAFHLMDAPSSLNITGEPESVPYIEMTKTVLSQFHSSGKIPDIISVEGDWSNAAFWLAAKALGNHLSVGNLNSNSAQGDRIVIQLLDMLREKCIISAKDIPDLIPILSVVAAVNQGAVFTGIERLRLKESDRISSIIDIIENLGGSVSATDDTLTIYSTGLSGGIVDSHSDHRIAMAAAIASTVCHQPVIILNAESVRKSYPRFWEDFRRLGGNYEQYVR